MHTHTVGYQGNGNEEKVFEKKRVFKDLKEPTEAEYMTNRNRELVPDSWNLVRE